MSSQLDEAEQQLAESRQRTQILQVAQMRPDQSPQNLALLAMLERSQRAETRLRRKAVQHLQTQGQQPPQSPSPDQAPNLSQLPGIDLSTKPGTSDSTT